MSFSCVTQAVSPVNAVPMIKGDQPHLRRIKAELVEIREELQRANANEPIVRCLLLWHQEFCDALSHPDTDKVILAFQNQLEKIFENPLKPEAPFSPRLFGIDPIPIVQFLIAKIRDPNSLLYSRRIDAAAPPDNPQEIFARIQAIQRENLQKQELKMPDPGQIKQRIFALREAQERRMQEIAEKSEQLLLLGQKIQAAREEITLFKNTVERLEREVKEHNEKISGLKVKIVDVRNASSALERENAQLEARLNRVESETKKEKSQWLSSFGELAISVAATWAISQIPLPAA